MDVKVEFHVRFLFVLLLSLSLRHAVRAETMNSTRNIRDGEVIVSDDGSFKLGFFSPRNSTYRYFGIWFGDVEEQTAVWVANREDPVKYFSGIFRIWEDGNLVVLDGNSNIHWSSNATFTTNTSVFELLKTGNLVLRNGSESDSDDNILWQSFDHPTDNFLADMKFGLNLMTGENQLLTDWRSDNNPAPGKFSLGFDPSGIAQIIIWNRSTTYWRSGIWNGQTFSGVPEMTSFHLYNFNIIKDNDNGKLYSTYSSVNVSAPSRFVLSSSGKLERSYWRNETNSWDIVWSQPNNECQLYGKCGPNGSCNWKKSPDICSCLKGFEPNSAEEWKLGNWSGGCVRKRALECEDGSTTDGFLKLSNVKLPDRSILEVAQETNECEDMCRKNCSCIAFAYERGLGCLTWRDSLQDIQIFDEGGQDLYLRLSKSDLKGTKKGHKHGDLQLPQWETPMNSNRHLLDKFDDALVSPKNPGKGPDLPIFALGVVRTATDDFSFANKLGEGGFGPVYKGKLPSGQEIAVKRLSKGSGQGLQEFENEVILIAKLQHRNLVRLLGCCIQGDEKLLLYEYMPNKSLDSFLFDSTKGEKLDWKNRFDIIEGIARGLLYLHRDSRLRIIHRDLKASNILLDAEMNPKISDFGMARIFGGKENQENTRRVVGTYGYMSPEYAMEGFFSVKSDVFSFGVLLLEIVSGKRNAGFCLLDQNVNLLGHAWELWKEDRMLELLDKPLQSSHVENEVHRCIQVGLLCVQDNAADRPTMDSVVFMLGNESAVIPSPQKPTFSLTRTPRESDVCGSSSGHCSANGASANVLPLGFSKSSDQYTTIVEF
ncbi:G-type lectin S-receptor-like serine/threonine-protein kinase At4g27290 [Pistacia vera]|uniref:G-type lectin S-receptor-like serine/threonine-protein kinase At4g27290 n=1 Tax=Pistacia vera TaxID=55513 RepID=UPI001263AA14|nr:G-type lectin S-receptor-like serine/threonine-protein kinase At4g27290 [Pistacia vera]